MTIKPIQDYTAGNAAQNTARNTSHKAARPVVRTATQAIALGLCTLAIAGCATKSSSPSVYRSGETQIEQTVRMATVEGVRKVMIQRDSKGVGVVGGAVVGGIAGSSVGGGTGRDIATVLGAIGGMVAGQAIEDKANQREGLEVTVKYDSGQTSVIVQEDVIDLRVGDRVQVISGGGKIRVAR
jgi:outer membrane lipoprotein SlyB